jgi:hypothetical protein
VALGVTLIARRAATAEPWRRLAAILLLVPAVALGLTRADHALRAVFLTAGRHRVEFRYRQPSVFIGLGVTIATLAALGVTGVLARRRGRLASPSA